MKTLVLLVSLACAVTASAFQWPGGTMTVPYAFRGDEVFAGWVPSSPWGSAVFLHNPVVELRNGSNDVVAEYVATGGTIDWYIGARRSGNASFTVPAGNYTLTAREGRRLIRISGEGYSGFLLTIDSLADPVGAVPPNRAPMIEWTSAPVSVASGTGYTMAARGRDEDGNLSQVNIWKNGTPFAFAGGGTGAESTSGNTTSDAGPATVSYSAQAVDAVGAASSVITHVVTIEAPVPVNYTLSTSAGPGGSVTPGGTFAAGTVVLVHATPNASHDFVGWSGGAAGTANPLTITLSADVTVVARFSPKLYALATSASMGGSITPGGSYPVGTVVTVSAVADAMHYFAGWNGDAGGNAPSVAVLMDRAKAVQALFAPKASQSITFESPGPQPVGAVVSLAATASSGLSVSFQLVSGPATLADRTLTITGPGAVTVRAVQEGDAWTLPAPPVVAALQGAAPVIVKYQSPARTLLQTGRGSGAVNYVLGQP